MLQSADGITSSWLPNSEGQSTRIAVKVWHSPMVRKRGDEAPLPTHALSFLHFDGRDLVLRNLGHRV